jgi:tetratricopeptide (TPR) repeat protein
MDRAVQLYNKLLQITSTSDNQLEGLRGKIRCLYKLKRYADAQPVGEELLNFKSAGNDDKAISHLVIGYAYQQKGSFDQAIQSFKQVASINKGEWAAEARYQISKSYFDKKDLAQSEKMAYEVINKSGSYEYWVASTYLLLGDIYLIQKDYFNAKATYQSVADNVTIEELKTEAKKKLDVVIEAEKKNSKIN